MKKSFWNRLCVAATRLHRDETGQLGGDADAEGQAGEPGRAPEGQPDGEGVLVPDMQSIVQQALEADGEAEPGPEPEPARDEPAAYNPLDIYPDSRFGNVQTPEEHVKKLGQSYENLERSFHERDEEVGRLRAIAEQFEQLKSARPAGQPAPDVEPERWTEEEVADLLASSPMQVFNDFGTQLEKRFNTMLEQRFGPVNEQLGTLANQPAEIESRMAWQGLCQRYPDAPKFAKEMIATRDEVGMCPFEDHLRYLREIKRAEPELAPLVAEFLSITDSAGNHKFTFERARHLAESERARSARPAPTKPGGPMSTSTQPRGGDAVLNVQHSDVRRAVEDTAGL